jgi:hypothetical protein
MVTKQAYRKKYVQFKWWQYGRWFAVIIFVTFCLGFAAGFLSGQRWVEGDTAALVHEN